MRELLLLRFPASIYKSITKNLITGLGTGSMTLASSGFLSWEGPAHPHCPFLWLLIDSHIHGNPSSSLGTTPLLVVCAGHTSLSVDPFPLCVFNSFFTCSISYILKDAKHVMTCDLALNFVHIVSFTEFCISLI